MALPRGAMALSAVCGCGISLSYSLTIFAFQGLVVKGIVKEYLFVMLMPSHSHRETFCHIEFHLLIGFPLSY